MFVGLFKLTSGPLISILRMSSLKASPLLLDPGALMFIRIPIASLACRGGELVKGISTPSACSELVKCHGKVRTYVLKDCGKLVIVNLLRLPAELEKLGFEILASIGSWDDGDDYALLRITAATDLRGVACAQSGRPGEVEPRQALEHRTFTRGLVTNDHELFWNQRD